MMVTIAISGFNYANMQCRKLHSRVLVNVPPASGWSPPTAPPGPRIPVPFGFSPGFGIYSYDSTSSPIAVVTTKLIMTGFAGVNELHIPNIRWLCSDMRCWTDTIYQYTNYIQHQQSRQHIYICLFRLAGFSNWTSGRHFIRRRTTSRHF